MEDVRRFIRISLLKVRGNNEWSLMGGFDEPVPLFFLTTLAAKLWKEYKRDLWNKGGEGKEGKRVASINFFFLSVIKSEIRNMTSYSYSR